MPNKPNISIFSNQKVTHNIYYGSSVKNTRYSILVEWLMKLFKHLKSYYTLAQNTRIFNYLFECFTLLGLFVFFYFLTFFVCAFDDACSRFYLGGL